ncbi:MAG: hypothetical protein H0T12_00555, partial [Actinobacteria bacterium]|nr:hypothetical protein [Actinomycetota bacterium]
MDALVDRRVGTGAAGALTAGVVTAGVALGTGSSQWTMILAGALLLGCGFAVMAPCQLQMSAMLTHVVRNIAARTAETVGKPPVVRAAWLFSLGYLVFYIPVALLLGGLALLLGPYAWLLCLVGGVMAMVLGLAALGALPRSWLTRCRGPLYLLRSGRASFRRPFSAGMAFGQYCATCCGPYLYALLVVAGATGAFWLGAGLVALYSVTMVVPFLLPAVLTPDRYAALGGRV